MPAKTKAPARYLSATEVAALIGVQRNSLARYRLPEPDVLVGEVRGWKEATITEWHANRPGQGWRKGQTK